MASFVELVNATLGSVDSLFSIGEALVGVGGGAVVLNALPRAGPMRAVTLGARTWFFRARELWSPVRLSQRTEVDTIKDMLNSLDPKEGQYIVVYGQGAIGTFCFSSWKLMGSAHLDVYN